MSYSYKPSGMRYSKTLDGIKTTHVWDGLSIVLDISDNNRVKGIYLRGSSLCAKVQDNSTHFYLHNAHGDVVYLTDENTNLLKYYDYSAFGIENRAEKNDSNPFRYCGEYYDKEIKNIYLRARYYDPAVGRFTSKDPIGDGQNWYAYCNNNPVMFVDPSGLKLDTVDKTPRENMNIFKTSSSIKSTTNKYLDDWAKSTMTLEKYHNGDDISSDRLSDAISWWAKNGSQNSIGTFDMNALSKLSGFDGYNNGNYDFDRYDMQILGLINYVNAKFDLSIDANDIKTMMAQESKIGYYNNGNRNGSIDVMQVLDHINPAVYRLAALGNFDKNEGNPKLMPRTGYGLFQKLFPDGKKYDASAATVNMSILGGIIWYQHRGGSFSNYNGGGDNEYVSKLNNIKNTLRPK